MPRKRTPNGSSFRSMASMDPEIENILSAARSYHGQVSYENKNGELVICPFLQK